MVVIQLKGFKMHVECIGAKHKHKLKLSDNSVYHSRKTQQYTSQEQLFGLLIEAMEDYFKRLLLIILHV